MRPGLVPILFGQNTLPPWVLLSSSNAPATLDYDFQNNRYWYNGKRYSSESSLLAAIGGSISGATRLVGPFITGPELLTNGTFDTATTGWAESNGGSIAIASAEMVLTAGGNLSCFSQGISASDGQAFRFTGTGRRGTTADNLAPVMSPNADLSSGFVGTTISSTSATAFTNFVGQLGATTYFGARDSSATGTGTSIFDAFSVKQAMPFLGWSVPAVTVVVSGITPTAQAANQVVWQADADSEQNRIRLRRNSADGHFVLIVTVNVITQVQLDIGAVADNTEFSVAFSCAQNSFTASLDGGAPVTDVSGELPGTCFMRIGRDFTGGTAIWGAPIHRVTVM